MTGVFTAKKVVARAIFILLLLIVVLLAAGKWVVGAQGTIGPVEEESLPGGACDFGRHPQKLWPDNPSGHPFERQFCTCPGGDVECDPLDTLENNGLYCDEVPGCWAYAG